MTRRLDVTENNDTKARRLVTNPMTRPTPGLTTIETKSVPTTTTTTITTTTTTTTTSTTTNTEESKPILKGKRTSDQRLEFYLDVFPSMFYL